MALERVIGDLRKRLLVDRSKVSEATRELCDRIGLRRDLDAASPSTEVAARRWLMNQCQGLGLVVDQDEAGNVWAHSGQARVIFMGSHLDTVPDGGRFDGALGVVSGLEVLRSAMAAGVPEVWVALRANRRAVLEGVSLADLAAGALPESVARLTTTADAWQPH